VPGPIKGFGSQAFVTDDPTNWRNWLTEHDAKLTRHLMEAFYSSERTRPPRITRALWFHECTARTYHLDLRWVLVVTGLEALINVEKQRATQQFRTRTVGLANRCGVPWTDQDAKVAYGLRSKLAHGQHVSDPKAEHHTLYCRMEAVLRVGVRDALLNAAFGAIFADDVQIRTEWPLPSAAEEP
jgi:thiosulfate reductase cytochrome b subunit